MATLLVATLLLASAAPSAFAQDTSTGAAIALFDEGNKLLNEGKYGEACPKLAKSQQLAPSGGTLLALADCYERNGQVASAWVSYRVAALRASAANKPEPEQKALAAARRLEPLVSWVTIELAKPLDGIVVSRDDQTVSLAELGVPLPFDPGTHAIAARAPGRRPWSTNVAVPATGTTGQRFIITIPNLEVDRGASDGATAERTQRLAGYGIAALGVAGVVTGTVFGVRAISKNDEAAQHCRTETLCDPVGLSLDNEARAAARTSTILVVLGGAALAAGIALVLTARPANTKPPRTVELSLTLRSVGLSGRF